MNSLIYMQIFVCLFALGVAVSTFNPNQPYPTSITNMTGADSQSGKMTYQTLNIIVIIAAAICLFETYQQSFKGGMGGAGMGGGDIV